MKTVTVPMSMKDHITGKKNAPVTLLEYGDFECPYCGQAYPIVERIREIEGDDLRFVFRHFPLTQIHPHALPAALAAEAAGKQKKFWEMHHLFFENQNALEDGDLVAYAEELGLDLGQFVRDMQAPDVRQKVREDFLSGIRSGVNGTPTFFINGFRFDGSFEQEYLLAAIEEAKHAGRSRHATA
jgi:protein-disulfide isomerase